MTYGFTLSGEIGKTKVWDSDSLSWVAMTQPVVKTDSLTVAGSMSVSNFPSAFPESAPMALQLYEDGSVLYLCKAVLGSGLSDAVWQIAKIDTSTGVAKQWCDGDALYNNTATDLATVKGHSYSF
jgi:hypothetical protein